MLHGLIFSRQISPKNLGGPVIILTASQTQLQLGFTYFLYFLALISINLAVLNLLPIPIVDGGLLLFLGIEKIRGKRVPDKVAIAMNYAGLAFLIGLILYVTRNDILRLLGLL
jgi:regulator of sigma E protease